MYSDDDRVNVAREERIQLVLGYLVESDSALPPAAIFRNLKLRGATFERRSVTNFLADLHDRGLVQKVDMDALDEGRIEVVSADEQGYWMATDKGIDAVASR